MRAIQGLVVAVLLGMGCMPPNTEIPLEASKSMLASEGMAFASEAPNGNTLLTIHVKHLPQPSRVSPDTHAYVVWVQPADGPPQNVGVLSVDTNLKGSLTTITPHKRFRVLITPEHSGQVVKPTHDEVFTSTIERVD